MFIKLINDQFARKTRSSVLFQSNDHQITLHDIESDITVITFGYWGSGLSQKGFGTDFCLKNGFNNIYVCCKGPQRFQYLSLEMFTGAIENAIKDKEVITYGLSLGGYAAIYYGGPINARIVAFSPRNLSHPVTRKIKQTFTHTQIYKNPITDKTPIVILDPFDSTDFTFLKKAISPAYEKMHIIHIDNAGHSCFGAIKNSGKLKPFLLNLFAGKVNEMTVEDKYKVEYLIRKAEAYMNSPAQAEPFIYELIKLEPNRRALRLAKEYILTTKKSFELPALSSDEIRICLANLDNAFTEKSMAYDILTKTASVLEEAGEFQTALSLYKLAVIKWPDNQRSHQKVESLTQLLNLLSTNAKETSMPTP